MDDISLSGRDAGIAALDAHPNITIHVFNPFAHRDARIIDFATDLDRVNHRMHNKIMVMDIANGMEIYEMRPDAGIITQHLLTGKSKAALHTKALVFDRKAIFIGSFNLDPRSASINTEAGLFVESPELAAQLLDYMDEGIRPENSYRVLLDENGDLVWVTEIDGEEVRYDDEPETTFGQRFMSDFISFLPVEEQL